MSDTISFTKARALGSLIEARYNDSYTTDASFTRPVDIQPIMDFSQRLQKTECLRCASANARKPSLDTYRRTYLIAHHSKMVLDCSVIPALRMIPCQVLETPGLAE